MAKGSLATLLGPELFQYCASNPGNDEYWAEFVRRYNPLLVRSIVTAWRRCGQGNWPPPELAEDLLNNVYVAIFRHNYRLLQNFRGKTEEEANAYLAETAHNQVYSFLRAKGALRRLADEVPLEELINPESKDSFSDSAKGSGGRIPQSLVNRPPKMTERELVEILERCFDGPNGKRDILIFLLHVRDGYTTAEISSMDFCNLKPTSINNLIGEMKTRLRNYFTNNM